MCVLRRSSTCLGDKRNKKGEKNDRLKFYDSPPYHLTCLPTFTQVLTMKKVSLTPLCMFVLFLVSPSSHTSTHFHSHSSLSLPFLQSKPPHLFTLTLHTQTQKYWTREYENFIFSQGMSKNVCKRS